MATTDVRSEGLIGGNEIRWQLIPELQGCPDVRFERTESVVKMVICRPEVRNAFRPQTLRSLEQGFLYVRDDPTTRVVILCGDGTEAFCSGGDQSIRSDGGYVGNDGVPRLEVLDLHIQMRRLPKPVIAMVAGYAVGGGHILHMVCDLTIAADNAVFGQTGPKVGSFDGGYGSSYMSRIIGQKRAREMWFLCRQYSAKQAYDMGLVNIVVPLRDLEKVTMEWCQEICEKSPTAVACIKAAMNADCDGQAGLSQLAGETTRLFYQVEESHEGKRAFLEKRKPDFKPYARF